MDALTVWTEAALWRLALATLQSLPLAGLVWLLCRALPRLGAVQRCWLWWLLSLQLLLGLAWPTPVLLRWLPAPAAIAQVVTAPVAALPANAAMVLPQRAIEVAAQSISATFDPVALALLGLLALWVSGVALMSWRSLRDWRVVRQRVAEASREVPEPLRDRCHALARRLQVTPPVLALSASIDSPQLVGVLRPHLLLPTRMLPALSQDAIEMALRHELVHLQRRDLLWGWLPTLAQHLFFFHPIAHLAAREYALAREGACDAAVLADPRLAPQDYGRLLLQFGVAPRAVAVVGAASPDFIALKRRLVMLQSHVPAWRIAGPLLVAVVGVVGVMPYRVVAQSEVDPAARANQATAKPAAKVQASVAAVPEVRAVAEISPVPAPAPIPAVAVLPLPPKPAVPPPPPPPPAPPKPPKFSESSSVISFDDEQKTASVLIEGSHLHAIGASSDVEAARRAQKNGETVWWFRQGESRYLVRDPALIARLKRIYAPVSELGRQQSELGSQQSVLGGGQSELGAQISTLAARQAKLAATTRHDGAGQEKLHAELAALSSQIEALAARQQVLADKQRVLGDRQKDAVATLRSESDRLASEAIRSGAAQRLQ